MNQTLPEAASFPSSSSSSPPLRNNYKGELNEAEKETIFQNTWQWIKGLYKKPTWKPPPIPNFSEYNIEVKDLLLKQCDINDGVQVQHQRILGISNTHSSQISHSVTLGSNEQPPEYSFSASYRSLDGNLQAQRTTNGVWYAHIKKKWARQFSTLVAYQGQVNPMNPSEHASSLNINQDYKDADYRINAKAELPGGIYSLSYMRALTKKVIAGIQAQYNAQLLKSSLTSVIRLRSESNKVATMELNVEDGDQKSKGEQIAQVKLSYFDEVIPGLSYGGTLSYDMSSKETQAFYGFSQTFINGNRFRVTANDKCLVRAQLEHKMSPTSQIQASVEAKPISKEMKFGVILQFMQ